MKEKSFYHPELDALRFWAFLQVFYFHVGSRFIAGNGVLSHHGWLSGVLSGLVQGGSLGVDLFFCLSSFLITSLLLRECDVAGTLDVRQFWIRRILRIWPLYFVFLAAVVFVLPHVPGLGNQLSAGYTWAFALFCGNWACVFGGLPASVAAPLWSVSVEEQFYVLWPLLLFIFTPRRLVPLAVTGWIVASLTRIILVGTHAIHSDNPVIWMNTLTRLDPIAIGAIGAVVIRKWKWNPTLRMRLILGAAGLLLPPVMVMVMGFDGAINGSGSLVFYPVTAMACACLVGAVYREDRPPVPQWAVYLGRISYGLYVFHMLAIVVANQIPSIGGAGLAPKILNALVFVAATFALTVCLAALSYRFLEQPFLRLKSKFTVIRSGPVQPDQPAPGGFAPVPSIALPEV